MPSRRAALSLALLSVPATVFTASGSPASAATTGFQFVDIAGAGGVVLKANVIAPGTAGGASSAGRAWR